MVDEAMRARAQRELSGWRLDGETLVGRWKLTDFARALSAAVEIGELAERADHHPDLEIGWGRLVVRLTTHSAGALTSKDIDLAVEVQRTVGPPNA